METKKCALRSNKGICLYYGGECTEERKQECTDLEEDFTNDMKQEGKYAEGS